MFYCFFVTQYTAYELRISDWSSDVCSSDLLAAGGDCQERRVGGDAVEAEGAPVVAVLQGLEGGPCRLPFPALCGEQAVIFDEGAVGQIGRASGRGSVCQYW